MVAKNFMTICANVVYTVEKRAAQTIKALHLLPKMSASCISLSCRVPRNATHLFGNPAVPILGPVALRHQISLALPLSEILNRCQQRSIF
jgi:hypothetical protein